MSLELYCCDVLGDHEVICGRDRRKGGISAFFVLKTDQTTITAFSSRTEWLAAIVNGDVKIFEEISGEYPAATPIETESHIGCGPDNILDGFDHVFNSTDRAVTEPNDRNYEILNGCPFHFGWFDCQKGTGDIIRVIEENLVRIVVTPAQVEKGNQTIQVYNIVAKWQSGFDEFPMEYTAPPGIFATG